MDDVPPPGRHDAGAGRRDTVGVARSRRWDEPGGLGLGRERLRPRPMAGAVRAQPSSLGGLSARVGRSARLPTLWGFHIREDREGFRWYPRRPGASSWAWSPLRELQVIFQLHWPVWMKTRRFFGVVDSCPVPQGRKGVGCRKVCPPWRPTTERINPKGAPCSLCLPLLTCSPEAGGEPPTLPGFRPGHEERSRGKFVSSVPAGQDSRSLSCQ